MEEMLLFLVRFLAIWLVGGPVVTALHELAHAGAALLLTRGDVRVWLGAPGKEPHLGLGRLRLSVTPRPGFFGMVAYDPSGYSRLARATIIVAGPLASLLLTVGMFAHGAVGPGSGTWVGESVIVVFGYPAAIQLVATAIPWTYPPSWGNYGGMPSDGLRLVRVLRAGSSTTRAPD